jgi:DNA-binding NtrC family response regulator
MSSEPHAETMPDLSDPGPGTSWRRNELKFLVVEDSFADFDDLRRALLKMESFKALVTRAKTLEEARLARTQQSFHVALIDYNLGVESGARFLQEMGGRFGSMAPILITGLPDPHIQDVALRAGAIGLINKADLTPTALETTIRSALYTHEAERKLRGIIARLTASEPRQAGESAGQTELS